MSVDVKEKKCADITIEITSHMIEQMVKGFDLNSTVDLDCALLRIKIKQMQVESITEEQLKIAEEIKV